MTAPTSQVPPGFRAQCVHATLCPGCPLIRDSYGDQLAKKTARVRAATSGFFELAHVSVHPTSPAERAEGYRTRAKLVADAAGTLGLYGRGTHQVVDLPECRVLHPVLSRVAAALRVLLAEGALAAPERGAEAAIEGVDMSLVGDGVMLTLIAREGAARSPLERLAQTLHQREAAVRSVAISRRRANAVQLLGSNHEVVLGAHELRAHHAESNVYHYAAHGAFQQVHADTASALYARVLAGVRAAAAGRARVLELYAGSGALSLALAAGGASVLAVESFAPACERLARAAREQHLSLEVRQGDAGETAQALRREGQRFDVVVVNPPRRGLDVAVREAIVHLGSQHVAYVSCNPATLARDLAHWARAGFVARELSPFDMMPLTDQVETFAWLSRRALQAPEVLRVEGELLAVNKGPHEHSLIERVRALPGYEGAVSLVGLEASVSGVCLFVKNAGARRDVLERMAAKTERYFGLAKGVVHKRGKVDRPLTKGAGSVRTRYERLSVERGHSLLSASLEAGPFAKEQEASSAGAHQLRKHLALIGHPLIGDGRHDRATRTHFEMRHGLDRPFLHRAAFTLELDGRELTVEAPMAPDLELVLASLRERMGAA